MPENGACEGDLSIVLSSLSLASMSWLSENLAFEMIAVIVLIAFLPGEGGWYWGGVGAVNAICSGTGIAVLSGARQVNRNSASRSPAHSQLN
jgi:hypothetical protein